MHNCVLTYWKIFIISVPCYNIIRLTRCWLHYCLPLSSFIFADESNNCHIVLSDAFCRCQRCTCRNKQVQTSERFSSVTWGVARLPNQWWCVPRLPSQWCTHLLRFKALSLQLLYGPLLMAVQSLGLLTRLLNSSKNICNIGFATL